MYKYLVVWRFCQWVCTLCKVTIFSYLYTELFKLPIFMLL